MHKQASSRTMNPPPSRLAGTRISTFFAALLLSLVAACAHPPEQELPPPAPTETLESPAESRDQQAPGRPVAPIVARQEAGRRRAEHHAQSAQKLQAAQSSADQRRAFHPGILPPAPPPQHYNREGYQLITENRFHDPQLSPLSTFGLDVDTAAYSNLRRFINQGRLPPADAVRIEELVNYFDYDHAAPTGEHPVSVSTELGRAPWNPDHYLAMVGVRAQAVAAAVQPAKRLVFLIDTSGSMNQADKLPLLRRSFAALVEQLGADDRVAIVTYAGSAGLALASTDGRNKEAIYRALNELRAGGSTAGAQGIELAYQIARQQFDEHGNNRVILATDGDFNVGPSSDGELVRMIQARRDQGIFLTVLGFGQGNLQDGKMHQIADHGNGNYYYIDTDLEARRVLSDKLSGTLLTVAKDVKLQVEFNPATVASYRLIGYESRQLAAEDFVDDRKDAGELGAGHTVTALYEIVPVQGASRSAVELRYQAGRSYSTPDADGELMQVKTRYKMPDQSRSLALPAQQISIRALAAAPSADWQWASTVAEFGMLLRASEHRGQASYSRVLSRAERLAVTAQDDLAREFVGLVRQAKVLAQARLSG